MFARRYFAPRAFARRYYPIGGSTIIAGGYFTRRFFPARFYAPRYFPLSAGPGPGPSSEIAIIASYKVRIKRTTSYKLRIKRVATYQVRL